MVYSPRIGPDGAFIREIHDIRERIKSIETKPTGSMAIREQLVTTDPDTGVKTIVGQLPDGSFGVQPFVGDITPPPVASVPVVTAQPGIITVAWDGLFVNNEAQPRDFEHVNVIGHKIVNGTVATSLVVGVLRLSSDTVIVTQDVATIGEEWQFSLESEDYNGNKAARGVKSASVFMLSAATDTGINDALDQVNQQVISAQNAAASAQTSADNAQTAADNAAQAASDAAGIASSKSKVLIQSTAPASADQNSNVLWIDTTNGLNAPKRWDGSSWVTVTDKAATDAAAAAAAAQTKADQAFNNAASAATAAGNAQTTADGKNRVWYQTSSPAGSGNKVGDTWFDTDDGYKIYVWDGSTWKNSQDSGIAAAQTTANSKTKTYYQTTQPSLTGNTVGDIWFDTSNGNKPYVWNGTIWSSAQDASISTAQSTANSALTSANGKNRIYYQTAQPSGGTYIAGDTWFDTDDGNKIYVYNGSSWIASQDATIATAQSTANTALNTANAKTKTYFQNTQPSNTGNTTGDIWFDTGNGNKAYVWNGTAWTVAQDTTITKSLFGTFSTDIDTTAPNKWLFTRYDKPTAANTVPSYLDIVGVAGTSSLIADSANLVVNIADNYIGQLRTIVNVVSSKTIAITGTHDDGAQVYVDGVSVYTKGQYTSVASVSFTLSAGWHVLDFLWAEQSGGDGWSNISPTIGSQVTSMYAPVSLTATASTANSALSTANSKVKTYFQSTQPGTSGNTNGDLWFDTGNGNKVYIWNGSAWTSAQDTAIAAAQTSANGKNRIYYQTAQPTGGTYIAGDTWFDTDDGNKIYVYSGSAWVNAQDATIATAQTTANNAQTAANTAQTTANAKTTTFTQATAPSTTGRTTGDIWFDTSNGNKPMVWSGSAWVSAQDAAIATAQTTANNAQTSANGKNTVFYQGTAPTTTGRVTGDTWFDTSNGYRISVWNGSAWTLSQDASIATAQSAANSAQTTANSKTKTFIQGTAPTATTVGDIWIDTANGNVIKTWEGSSWVTRADAAIAAAQTSANNAQTAANGKNTIISAASAPATAGHINGDIWFDTSNGNKPMVFSTNAWVSAQDASIATAQSAAVSAQNTANSKTKTFIQGTAPTATTVGDIWIDTANGNVIKTWEGSTWVNRADSAIAAAQTAANTAQTTANGKNTIISAATAPATAGHINGDIWFDTSNGNKPMVFSGTGWVTAQDASIATAQSSANSAQTTANTKTKTFIQGTAPTATTVGDIWIDTSNGNVIKTWEGSSWVNRADAAIAAAQSAANSAQTSANGKNTIISAASAPATAGHITGDIWFDTSNGNKPMIFNGTAWVSAQDASIATAQSSANTAQTTANGKNAVTYSSSVASGSGTRAGDVWFQTGSGGVIIGQWQWSGSAWVQQTIDNAVIANLDAGKINAGTINAARIGAGTITSTMIATDTITAGNIASGAITASELAAGSVQAQHLTANSVSATAIAANTITANQIAGSTITGAQIAANTITSGNIAADTITAGNIAAGAVTASELAAGSVQAQHLTANSVSATAIAADSITAGQIAAGAITASELAAGSVQAQHMTANSVAASAMVANTITAGQIASSTITSAQIAANTITAGNIAADTITSGQIASDAITANELAAGSITAAKGQISDLAVTTAKIADTAITNAKIADATIQAAKIGSVDAGTITVGTLNAARIGANSITASKMLIADMEELIPNPFFNPAGEPVTMGSIVSASTTPVSAGAPYPNLYQFSSRDNHPFSLSPNIAVKDGDQFYLEVWVATSTAIRNFNLYMFGSTSPVGGLTAKTSIGNITPTSTWTKVVWNYTVSTGGAYGYIKPVLQINNVGGETTAQMTWYATGWTMRRKNTGNLIVDGAIQAGSAIIGTGAIGTAQIGNLAVTSAQIANQAVGTAQIADLSVGTAKIADTAITNAKIANLDAGKITTGTLDANRIGVDSITASMIATDAITANELAANSITAAKGQISDLAVTTAKINDAAITTAKIANLAVGTAQIADAAINNAKIANLDAGKITTGTLDANRIGANTISASKLMIGDFENLATISEANNITVSSYGQTQVSGGYNTLVNDSGQFFMFRDQTGPVPFKNGDRLYYKFTAKAPVATSATFAVYIYNSTNGNKNTTTAFFNIGTTDTVISGNILVPSSDSTFGPAVQYVLGLSNTSNKGIQIKEVVVRRMNGGELLVDGTIQAGSAIIGTGAIGTAQIANLAVDTAQIKDGAITNAKIVDATIQAAKIGSVDAGTITAGLLSASRIGAKSITTDKLVVSSTNNLVVEADFGNGGSSWGTLNSNKVITTNTGRNSLPALRVTGTTATQTISNLVNKVAVGTEDRFRGSFYMNSSAAAPSGAVKLFMKAYSTATSSVPVLVATSQAVSANNWTLVEGYSAAFPSGVTSVEFYLEVTNAATSTTMDIDYVAVTRAADARLVVDGAIDGKTITGATIQTASPALSGARLVMDSTGLRGWDSSNKQYISASANGLAVTGALGASGNGVDYSVYDSTTGQYGSRPVYVGIGGAAGAVGLGTGGQTWPYPSPYKTGTPIPGIIYKPTTVDMYDVASMTARDGVIVTLQSGVTQADFDTWANTLDAQGNYANARKTYNTTQMTLNKDSINFSKYVEAPEFRIGGQSMNAGLVEVFDFTSSVGNAQIPVKRLAGSEMTINTGKSTDTSLAAFDPNGLYINNTGVYNIHFSYGLGVAGGTRNFAEIGVVNDDRLLSRAFFGTAEDSVNAVANGVKLTAGDVVKFELFQNSGQTASFTGRIRLSFVAAPGPTPSWGAGDINQTGNFNLQGDMLSKPRFAQFYCNGFTIAGASQPWDSGPVTEDTSKSRNNNFATVGPSSGSVKFTQTGWYQISHFMQPTGGNPPNSWARLFLGSTNENLVQQGNGPAYEIYLSTVPIYITAGDYVRSTVLSANGFTTNTTWKIVKFPWAI